MNKQFAIDYLKDIIRKNDIIHPKTATNNSAFREKGEYRYHYRVDFFSHNHRAHFLYFLRFGIRLSDKEINLVSYEYVIPDRNGARTFYAIEFTALNERMNIACYKTLYSSIGSSLGYKGKKGPKKDYMPYKVSTKTMRSPKS